MTPAPFRPLIVWYMPDLPPIHVDEGPDSGKGVADLVLRLAMAELSGFRHEVRHAPFPRVIYELQNNSSACTPTLLGGEVARPGLTYSSPYLLAPGPQLLLNPAGVALANRSLENGKIDPVAFLLLQPRLGKVRQLRFGAVDSLIARYPLLTESSSEEPLRNLALMLKQGHLDAALVYPGEARWLKQLHPEFADLTLMPLAPSQKRSEASAACNDSPLGQRVIRALDPLLKRERLGSIAENEAYWGQNLNYKEEARRHFGRTGLRKRVPK